MRHVVILIALLSALGLLVAACGGDGDEPLILGGQGIVPIPGNSELIVGPNRFALALLDEQNSAILEEPGISVHLRFLYQDEVRNEQDARFTWAIPDASGFFTADVDFDEAGQWEVEAVLSRDGEETVVSFSFPVRSESQLPNVGDPAPPSANLTLAQEPNISRLSTDQEPEPALYELTIAEAIETGQPLVVIFATPAFCQTRFCGPMVDNVKEVRQEYIDQVNFIHIEPFELDDDSRLVTSEDGGPIVAPTMLEWRLQSEPWVFVVGADGRITARFEGAASPSELRQAIQQTLS